jgi:DNA-binding protein HU-beta
MAAGVVGKKDLVDHIAHKGHFTKKSAETVLNAFMEAVTQGLAHGNSVRIIPFGSFEIRHRSARIGRNPRTGQAIKIAARKVPIFKPGKGLKDLVK